MTELFRYGWMQRELLIYAESVCEGMNERVKEAECQKDVEALKEMFNLFKGKPDLECSKIYSRINNSISEYVGKQEKEHQSWKEKIVQNHEQSKDRGLDNRYCKILKCISGGIVK